MKKTSKQIAAIICVVLLVLLYIATLVIAILDFPGSDKMFAACLLSTIGLPILLWIYLFIYGKFTGRPTITDSPKTPNSKEENRPDDEEES